MPVGIKVEEPIFFLTFIPKKANHRYTLSPIKTGNDNGCMFEPWTIQRIFRKEYKLGTKKAEFQNASTSEKLAFKEGIIKTAGYSYCVKSVFILCFSSTWNWRCCGRHGKMRDLERYTCGFVNFNKCAPSKYWTIMQLENVFLHTGRKKQFCFGDKNANTLINIKEP